MIDKIWSKYDVDNSGTLDKQETKQFVNDTLKSLGDKIGFSDSHFDLIFTTFDTDGSGTLERDEMVIFMK